MVIELGTEWPAAQSSGKQNCSRVSKPMMSN